MRYNQESSKKGSKHIDKLGNDTKRGKREMKTDTKENIKQEDLDKIAELIGTVQYGTVTIVIQDGRIVQLEKHEKLRLA